MKDIYPNNRPIKIKISSKTIILINSIKCVFVTIYRTLTLEYNLFIFSKSIECVLCKNKIS